MRYDEERSEESIAFTIRITERVQRDIDSATLHLAQTTSPTPAVAWREGLYLALESLSSLPRRCTSVLYARTPHFLLSMLDALYPISESDRYRLSDWHRR